MDITKAALLRLRIIKLRLQYNGENATQEFEFSNFHQCFTESWRYIFKFLLLGILLIALLCLFTGIVLFLMKGYKGTS